MADAFELSVKKPVSAWNKPLKANFKDLFKSLGKAAVDGAAGKWDGLAKDMVDASTAVGLSNEPAQIAWLLIYRSLTAAMASLVQERLGLFQGKPRNLDSLCDQLDLSLEESELTLDAGFFEQPKQLPILQAIQVPFRQWLNQGLGVKLAEAEAIAASLPSYFVFALNQEWVVRASQYDCLQQPFNTPFTRASERERDWLRYRAWLQRQVEEPMIVEVFGLERIYVPPRAYYLELLEEESRQRERLAGTKTKQYRRVVVSLEAELDAWVNKGDRRDAIRVISGGPGSGKSSFAKIFAARQAARGAVPVLFVPLHHFDPTGDLVQAMASLIRDSRLLAHNPLDPDDGEPRLLLIFDGLDELAMQGNVGAEVARQFVDEVRRKVDRFNLGELRLQVLLSGRELVVQDLLRQPQQILHLLPYYIAEQERKDREERYVDAQGLLAADQRQTWWQQYAKAKGLVEPNFPEPLKKKSLTEITSQPLLNYLVVLSYLQGDLNFDEDTTLNDVYANLLKAVYKRDWAGGKQHPSLEGIDYPDFIRLLEEIALTTWHGNGRTTTLAAIEKRCQHSGLQQKLALFQAGNEEDKSVVTRLLAAFYFRRSGLQGSEKTFEFTHKSFSEYLTAKRLVRGLQRIQLMRDRQQEYPEDGWDEKAALAYWAELCGPTAIDAYLLDFIRTELQLQAPETARQWQQTLCQLIGFMLRHGMPMERLTHLRTFQTANQQARNAELALLAVLNACARSTEACSAIDWPPEAPEAFGHWLSRLAGQRPPSRDTSLALCCLSYLDLQRCCLIVKDLSNADLSNADLSNADLSNADLSNADLSNAVLSNAVLSNADLSDARGLTLEQVQQARNW